VLVQEALDSASCVVLVAADASSVLVDRNGKSNAKARLDAPNNRLNKMANDVFFKFIIEIL
jgi:hypothetical protein